MPKNEWVKDWYEDAVCTFNRWSGMLIVLRYSVPSTSFYSLLILYIWATLCSDATHQSALCLVLAWKIKDAKKIQEWKFFFNYLHFSSLIRFLCIIFQLDKSYQKDEYL